MKHKRDFKALEQRRLKAARLLKQGLSQAEVARRLEVSRESVSRWAEQSEADGKDALRRKRLGRPPQLDRDQRRALGQALVQGAIANGFATELWTLPRVRKLIEQRFGVRYSAGHMWHLLRSLGFSCQRPAKRALQRDEAAIRQWRTKRWPALKKTPDAADKPSSS
jgi:putative transposase